MGCATSKDSTSSASSAPDNFAPKNESMNRSTTTDSNTTEASNKPQSKEEHFKVMLRSTKTPNAVNYSILIASSIIQDLLFKNSMSESDIKILYDIVDADHDGLINLKEFLELFDYIDLAVAEKKRVGASNNSPNQNRALPSQPTVTKVENPVASSPTSTKRKETLTVAEKPVEITPVVVSPAAPAVAPVIQQTPEETVTSTQPKRRAPSKRIVHIPLDESNNLPKISPISTSSAPISPLSQEGNAKKKPQPVPEEEEDDGNDANKPQQKKGFLFNDDINSSDANAKNYYVLDNGKLKYMDHATKQYQVIPLNNRKVQVSSDGVIELVSTEELAVSVDEGASPVTMDSRHNSVNSQLSPKAGSRISLRVKNAKDVDQWRAAIAEHQQYASTKEEAKLANGGSEVDSPKKY